MVCRMVYFMLLIWLLYLGDGLYVSLKVVVDYMFDLVVCKVIGDFLFDVLCDFVFEFFLGDLDIFFFFLNVLLFKYCYSVVILFFYV